MSYLLDANVFSELTKLAPNSLVLQWLAAQTRSELWVSVVTLGEIECGILLLDDGHRKRNLAVWLERLRSDFAGQILDINEEVMRVWARLYAAPASRKGVRGGLDSLLAATVTHHELTLVTRNTKDFPSGVPVFDPWKG